MDTINRQKLEKWVRDLRGFIVRERRPITGWRGIEEDREGAQRPEFDDSDWKPLRVGREWGGHDTVLWLRGAVRVPRSWREDPVELHLKLSRTADGHPAATEGLLYINGVATQGLDRNHSEVRLTQEQKAAGKLVLAIRAWSGLRPAHRHTLAQLDLVRLNAAMEDLYYTTRTMYDVALTLGEADLRRIRLLTLLDEAYTQFQWQQPGSEAFYAGAAEVGQWLKGKLAEWAEAAGNDARPLVTGVGHAHIDVAWLWRRKHTREKAQRTFATALHLMREYPEYCFIQSQPQLYRYVAEDDPELYARIKEAAARGQWDATGGMWVEADCNLTSGESLVRQFLYGTRFFRREFGVECSILWLPDVFGYSWALPQLIRRSGLRYFMTTKISWNQYNHLPYDTFRWRGVDGSEVLTHFVTTPAGAGWAQSWFTTYNGMITAEVVHGTWARYQQQDCHEEVLHTYGFGDGGGGPTRDMLEYARHLKDVPAAVHFQLDTAEHFFARLGEKAAGDDGDAHKGRGYERFPVWNGELYLEYHRGTYTSQARNKRFNRESEVLFHNAELFSAVSDLLGGPAYPKEAFTEAWELILMNQFHDVIPGSSIREVYEDSAEDYAHIRALGTAALERALGHLASQVKLDKGAVIVFNPCSWTRSDLVRVRLDQPVPVRSLRDPSGAPVPFQVVVEADGPALLFHAENVPAMGYRAYTLTRETVEEAEGEYGPLTEVLNDPAVTHIQVQDGQIFCNRGGALEISRARFENEAQAQQVAQRLAAALGRTLDEDHPQLDQLLPDGSRVRLMIPPLALRGTNISIWKKSASNPLASGAASCREEEPTLTVANPLTVTPGRLENDFFRLTLNERGQITSLLDKRHRREVLAPGARANVFQLFEDRPLNFDAWDIDLFYQQKMWAVEDLTHVVVLEEGPERGVLQLTWRAGDSTITQRLTIYRATPRIDFVTHVDWQERQTLLKVAFPVDIHATKATYEIQFGNVERPTHWNTSWDWARFETCAQKWVDLSEGDYGVSLLNNCKYGHDIKDNVLRLTLLKSAIEPDPEADRGEHVFTYSLYPHAEDWARGGTVRAAYALNYPLLARCEKAHPGTLPAELSFVSVDAEHVIVETVKEAEDDDRWVVRAYEYANRRGPVRLTFFREIESAVECNLVEREEQPVRTVGRNLMFTIRPYEIRTFKVRLR